jgi:hypothetical protein
MIRGAHQVRLAHEHPDLRVVQEDQVDALDRLE